jgi:hypothetical protein
VGENGPTPPASTISILDEPAVRPSPIIDFESFHIQIFARYPTLLFSPYFPTFGAGLLILKRFILAALFKPNS